MGVDLETVRVAALACALLGKAPGCRTPLGPSRPVAALFLSEARAHDLEPDLLLAVCVHESHLDPTVVGLAGEIGVCQILPGGSAAMTYTSAALRQPWRNIRLAARHLQRLRGWCRADGWAVKDWVGIYSGAYGRHRRAERCGVTNYGRRVEKELAAARVRMTQYVLEETP